MKTIITILLSFIVFTSQSQTIYVGYGTATLLTNQSVRLLNAKNDFSLSDMQRVIGFEYRHKQMCYLFSLSAFNAGTTMRLSSIHKNGFAGSHVRRVDIGVGYNLFKPHKKLFIKPFVMLGLQTSRRFGDIASGYLKVMGPDYFEINATSEGIDMKQLVPSLGVRMGVKIKKQIQVGLCFQGVYGFKTFQRIFFDYTYKDDPFTERRAVFDTRGTGLYSSLFIGIDLWKEGYDFKKFFSQ